LSKYFDVIVARPYPYKFLMISQIIVELDKVGLKVKPNEILFVDDRRGHFGNVWLYLGDVKCLEMWKDIMGYKDILNMITYVNDK
ncbi:magnesium-dependent phosphatase-1, partial [Sulfolobus sp. A20-N-F6]